MVNIFGFLVEKYAYTKKIQFGSFSRKIFMILQGNFVRVLTVKSFKVSCRVQIHFLKSEKRAFHSFFQNKFSIKFFLLY